MTKTKTMTMTMTKTGLTGLTGLMTLAGIMTMPMGSNAIFGIPDNVDFVTHLYNDSNCSNTVAYKNITLHHFCYDTQIEHGYPRCCNELLSEISLFENASFRQCIKTGMTDTNLTGVSYDCNMTHLKHLGTAGALSYIGLISMVLLVIMFIGYLVMVVCGGKTYSKIN